MILYLDCLRGVNAVSTLAALIDAGASVEAIAGRLRAISAAIEVTSSDASVDGLRANRIELRTGDVPHSGRLRDVLVLIEAADLAPDSRTRIARVYERLAAAEATVHGTAPDAVTFHEVGRPGSVLAVIALGIALELLDVGDVIASPLVVGGGVVETHHGPLSIPAPATLELLRRVPVREAATDGELVTPTGAAVVVELASAFGPIPSMTVERIGYGTDDSRHPMPVTRAIVGTPELVVAG